MGIWALLGFLMFVFGFLIVFYALKTGKKHPKRVGHSATIASKNALPITPRDARNLAEPKPTPKPVLSTPNIHTDADMASKVVITSAPATDTDTDTALKKIPIPKKEDTVLQTQFDSKLVAFDEEAALLEPHFQHKADDSVRDQDTLLANKATLTIFLTPREHTGIDGTTILQLAKRYGLKYGALNMFHRYENAEGSGMLWFSVLGVDTDGLQGFDLVELTQSNYRGLAFFLSLPHPNALAGFDSMTQIAYAIADELDADIHDDNGYFIGQNELEQLKSFAIHYE